MLPGELAGEPDVVVVTTSDRECYVTRDLGQSWSAPTGLPNFSDVREMARLEDASSTILILGRHGNSTSIYASTDYGYSFQQRWTQSQSWAGEMWVPRKGPEAVDTVYLVHRGRVRRSTDGGQTFSLSSVVDTAAVEGRLCGSEAGAPTLYVALRSGGAWTLRRSDDAGATWSAAVPMTDFWTQLEASTIDAGRVCYGGVEVRRSTDGGQTFSRINTWGEYYGDPLHKLHADIQGIHCWPDPDDFSGWDLWYFSTDGGIFLSTDLAQTVVNRSLDGLGVSQYYSTLTSSSDPSLILAGAQDQGYQRGVLASPSASGPSTDFAQLISGDYGHLTSSNGTHDLVYSTYPGFVLVQEGQASPNLLYPFVDFPAGADHLWLPPVVADPNQSTAFYFLGDRLWRYTRVGSSAAWTPTQHSAQVFTGGGGNYLSALAFAPSNPSRAVAVNDAGKAYHSNDGGVTWGEGTLTGTDSHYFYGSALAIHPSDELEVFMGGAGYSNPAVWRSLDGGVTWAAASTGLPPTLVYDLAYAADGSGDVFAAAESGAYRWSRASGTWENVMDPGTPMTLYWSVEAVPGAPVMRFGTYGRGIWDLDLAAGSTSGTWQSYGQGAGPANFLALDSATPPNLGATVRLDLSGGGGVSTGYLMAGRTQGSMPLFGGVQLVDQVVRTLPISVDAAGVGSRQLVLPTTPSLLGLDFYFQAVLPDALIPGGYALSNGLQMTIGM